MAEVPQQLGASGYSSKDKVYQMRIRAIDLLEENMSPRSKSLLPEPDSKDRFMFLDDMIHMCISCQETLSDISFFEIQSFRDKTTDALYKYSKISQGDCTSKPEDYCFHERIKVLIHKGLSVCQQCWSKKNGCSHKLILCKSMFNA